MFSCLLDYSATATQACDRPATWAVDFRAFGPMGALLEICTHPFSLG